MGLIPLVTSMPDALRYPSDTILTHTDKGNSTLATLEPESATSFALATRLKRKRLFAEPNPEGGVVARFGPRFQVDTNGGISQERKREREKREKSRTDSAARKEQIKRSSPRSPRVGGENGVWRQVATVALDARGRATSRSGTFLSQETRKRIGKAHVAFVTRGTAAITCQLWGTVCPVCLSLERESTEGGSRPNVKKRRVEGGSVISLAGTHDTSGVPLLATPCHVVGKRMPHNGRLCPRGRPRNVSSRRIASRVYRCY